MPLLLKNGRIVTENDIFPGSLLIKDGIISRVLSGEDQNFDLENGLQGLKTIDVSGCLVMPGVIDAHTHYQLRSRDTVTAGDFYSGTRSAALGGVTSFIDFADHQEDISLGESARSRRKQAEKNAVIDFNLHQTVHYFDDEIYRQLQEIRDMGISSIKMFTTYEDAGYFIPQADRAGLMEACSQLGLLPTVHAEHDEIITSAHQKISSRLGGESNFKLSDHADLRPAEAETAAVKRLGRLAREEDVPLYVDHISAGETMKTVEKLREEGANIAAETTPHYLCLDRGFLEGAEPEKYFMVPPLRSRGQRNLLRNYFARESVDTAATDHCAFSLAQKREEKNPLNMLPGIPGSETLLALLHHFFVNRNHISYQQLSRQLSTNPARLFGLYPQRGSIAEGSRADLVVFDPEKKKRLTSDNLHSAAGYSPYAHITVRGYPQMTIAGGEIIAREGELKAEKGRGEFISAGKSSLFGRK